MPKVDKNIEKQYNQTIAWINAYLNSEGFRQRYDRHNGRFRRSLKDEFIAPELTTNNSEVDHIVYQYGSRPRININPDNQKDLNNDFPNKDWYQVYKKYGMSNFVPNSAITHELGHHVDNFLSNKKHFNQSLLQSILDEAIGYKSHSGAYKVLTPKAVVNSHDMRRDENYADILAFRKSLYDDGIYNSLKANNPFTKKHLDKAKKKYKDYFVRPFNNFTDEELIEIMNLVAANDRNKLETSYYG